MGLNDVLALAGQFGPMGLLIAYLIWREIREDRWRRDHEEKRLDADRQRTAADVALARAMTGLTMLIQGRVDVQN